MEKEFLVPPHSDLDLDPRQCRNPCCLKMYKNEGGRKKHETDKHRYYEKQGRTVSPVMFDQPRQADTPTSRPLSCPPPEVATEFSTPVRPVRRRRPVSSCDTPTSRASPSSSPIGTPDLPLTPSPQFSSLFSGSQHSPTILNDWNVNHQNQCQFCLFTFKNQTNLKNHDKCLFRPNTLHLRVNKITPTVFVTS